MVGIPDRVLQSLVRSAVHTCDRYVPALRAVAFGSHSAAEAARAIEQGTGIPADAPSAPSPPTVGSLVRAFDAIGHLERFDAGALAKLLGVPPFEPKEEVIFGPVGLVSRPPSGLVEKVELSLHDREPSRFALTVHLRAPLTTGREVADAQWLAAGAAPPMAAIVNAPPSPGSSPEAFARWERERSVRYTLPWGEVTVGLLDDRIERISAGR